MIHITLPGIKSTVVTLLIMNLGRLMGSNFERLQQFGNTQVKDFQYQLAIYIYDKGLSGGKYSMATAVGLFQSVVGLILVILADKVAKKLGEDGLPVSVADYAGDYTQGYNNSKDYWCVTIEARNAGTIEDTIGAMSPKGLPQDFTQDIIDNYYAQVEASEKGWVPVDCMFATDIASVAEYQGTLLSLYAELRDALVMCDPAEFDALYEESAAKYAEAGYTAIAEERLEALNNGLSSTLE